MTTTSTLAVCLLTLLTHTVSFSRGSLMSSTIVNTAYGPVNGSVISLKTGKTVVQYMGIPFAKAERFEYPVEPEKWTSTLQAKKINKTCPYTSNSYQDLPVSEDCLQLNVFVPFNTTSSSLAVMLYITQYAIEHNGSVLATEGNVIVVTAAYRFGVFGFLSANSDNLKGNYGMMDQVLAMKWVNKNIARFGGDPKRVTIFGNSAVALLLLSPLASGLYQNVIIQSGTAVSLQASLERDEAEFRARNFAKALGCEFTSLKACAKSKSVQDLLAAQDKVVPLPNFFTFPPVVDGYLLPDSPMKLFVTGKFNKTNIIIGVTEDDGTVFTGVHGIFPTFDLSKGIPRASFKELINNRTWMRNQNSQILDLLIYEYTDWSNASDPHLLRQQFIDINTDANFKAPAIQSANAFVKKQFPTYFYQLEKAVLIPIPEWDQIYHGAEIDYIFGYVLLMPSVLATAENIQLSKDIMALWTNFAKTGNPNEPTVLGETWPQYTVDREEYLGLRPNLTVRSKMRPKKMALWNEFLTSIQETTKPTTSTTSSCMSTSTSKPEDNKEKLVSALAILTGLFGAVAVFLLVLLIVTCCQRGHRRNNMEEPLTSNSF